MAEQKKEGGEEEAEVKPKGKKKLIFIVLGLVLLVVGIGVPMFLLKGGKKAATEEEPVEEVKKIEMADLGQFVVNLSESSSFLKVHIILEYDVALIEHHEGKGGDGGGEGHGGGGSGGGEGEGNGGLHPSLKKKETQIRDAIIRVLSAKRADEMLTQDGKERLKEELIEGINEAIAMEEPPVTGVYFTEFIIQ